MYQFYFKRPVRSSKRSRLDARYFWNRGITPITKIRATADRLSLFKKSSLQDLQEIELSRCGNDGTLVQIRTIMRKAMGSMSRNKPDEIFLDHHL